MPKRWDGLTPTSLDSFEPLPARAFLNPLFEVATIADETFAIPSDTFCWSLDHIVHGNPLLSANLLLSSAGGGGGTVYAAQLTAPTDSYQVQVIPATGMLRFYSGDAGNTVYATYRAHVSNIDMATIAQMYAAIRSGASGATGGYYTAGEDVVAGCGYVVGGTVYQAVTTDLTKCGWVWITSAASSGASVLCQTSGLVATPRSGIPESTPLYCGHGGMPTWWADTDAGLKLNAGEYAHCIGVSLDGLNISLSMNQDVSRFAE